MLLLRPVDVVEMLGVDDTVLSGDGDGCSRVRWCPGRPRDKAVRVQKCKAPHPDHAC